SGRYILGPCHDTLLLRGVNYAIYNWGYSINQNKLAEIAQSGANTVRLVWYANSGGPEYSNFVALDSALSKCVQHKLIAVLELHDQTCANSPANLTALTSWWTQTPVLTILNKYKHSVIVNYANEALYVNWDNNPNAALATYKNTYQTIIQTLRNVPSFHFPIMIDAPDCGQHSDAFISSNTATDLIAADPDHNIIFSAHTYWFGYAANDSAQMAAKINAVIAANIPFVIGELANFQDDQVVCQYTLNYIPLLNYCQTVGMHWLIWSWDNDNCAARQLTTNGNFNSLTAFGQVIVNDPNFGLATHPPAKSFYLLNNGCNALSIEDHKLVTDFVFPNPNTGSFFFNSSSEQEVSLWSLDGKEVRRFVVWRGASLIDLQELPAGVYFLKTDLVSFKIMRIQE
ncbi:MAG: cellulase family glycosylhydrolase, partial [Bacteroidia bacterium]